MGEYVITAGVSNNGILGKSDVEAKVFKSKTITVDMFGYAFYRNFNYKMVTHARVFSLIPKFKITENQGMFLESSLSYLKKLFGYENMCSFAKIKNLTTILPTKNGKIDFDFMETFVAELEAQRVAELKNYLEVSGLDDYELSNRELEVLKSYDSVEWGEYRIGDLFEKVKVKPLKYKTSELKKIPDEVYKLPALTAGIENQGLNNYVPIDNATILQNVISISANGANTGVTFFQSNKFTVLQDAYAIDWKDPSIEFNRNNGVFISSVINGVLHGKYEWTNKAGWLRVQDEKIYLPTKNGKIDFDFMETYISAITKLAIKDVVKYADKRIAATKKIVNK